jgi:LPS-assembly lipoprotein
MRSRLIALSSAVGYRGCYYLKTKTPRFTRHVEPPDAVAQPGIGADDVFVGGWHMEATMLALDGVEKRWVIVRDGLLMWWRNLRQWRTLVWTLRLAIVLAAAALTAGCWQPLYGARPAGGEGVQDKFAAVDIPPITAPKGTPAERVAVGMRNALQFDLHNGGSTPMPPAYALKVNVYTTQYTAYVDPTTGRPDSQIQYLIASYQLVELATDKVVISDSSSVSVDYDIPGSQQRFTGQRARRDAEDRAVQVAADVIRNRLASYFVAGT